MLSSSELVSDWLMWEGGGERQVGVGGWQTGSVLEVTWKRPTVTERATGRETDRSLERQTGRETER